jgi:hypothetical protein
MRMKTTVAALLLILPTLVAAQQKKIYLDPKDSFSAYFSSAIQKKSVPVTVTTDPAQADYTVNFQGKDSNGSIIQGIASAMNEGWWNSGAFNEVSMSIVDVRSKDVAFSYTCKKYDQYSGQDSRMATSVAECLAKHWKSKLH